MEKKYVLALDQGTTSSRAIIFDRNGAIVSSSQHDLLKYILNQVGLNTILWKSGKLK